MRIATTHCLVVCLLVASPAASAAETAPRLPAWTSVEQTVRGHFAGQKNHREGDLICRGQAEAALDGLAAIGWHVADRDEILALLLPDDDFLIREQRTAAGRRFLRAAGAYEGGYDRLDRLARMPHGRQTIRDLAKANDGERLVEYMTQTDGGRNLGRQLADAPRGDHFNRPTGRIYTVEQLLARLRESHEAAR